MLVTGGVRVLVLRLVLPLQMFNPDNVIGGRYNWKQRRNNQPDTDAAQNGRFTLLIAAGQYKGKSQEARHKPDSI